MVVGKGKVGGVVRHLAGLLTVLRWARVLEFLRSATLVRLF
jgi:hypothetical protein